MCVLILLQSSTSSNKTQDTIERVTCINYKEHIPKYASFTYNTISKNIIYIPNGYIKLFNQQTQKGERELNS